MRRSELENYEELEIVGFDLPKETDKEVSVDKLVLTVPFGTTPFAKAALVKGFLEYFLKISGDGDKLDPRFLEMVENNLEVYKKKVAKVKNQTVLLSPTS
jgi:hypothetical protein